MPGLDESMLTVENKGEFVLKHDFVLTPEMEALIPLFKSEVTDKMMEVDPNGSEDWFSLTLGWAIAKGLNPVDANFLASHIRYNTDLA